MPTSLPQWGSFSLGVASSGVPGVDAELRPRRAAPGRAGRCRRAVAALLPPRRGRAEEERPGAGRRGRAGADVRARGGGGGRKEEEEEEEEEEGGGEARGWQRARRRRRRLGRTLPDTGKRNSRGNRRPAWSWARCGPWSGSWSDAAGTCGACSGLWPRSASRCCTWRRPWPAPPRAPRPCRAAVRPPPPPAAVPRREAATAAPERRTRPRQVGGGGTRPCGSVFGSGVGAPRYGRGVLLPRSPRASSSPGCPRLHGQGCPVLSPQATFTCHIRGRHACVPPPCAVPYAVPARGRAPPATAQQRILQSPRDVPITPPGAPRGLVPHLTSPRAPCCPVLKDILCQGPILGPIPCGRFLVRWHQHSSHLQGWDAAEKPLPPGVPQLRGVKSCSR